MAPPQFKTQREIYLQEMAIISARFPGALLTNRSLLAVQTYAHSVVVADSHIQGARILDTFSIGSAKGEDLDRRVAALGMTRLPSRTSRGEVRFGDTRFTTRIEGNIVGSVLAGATVVNLGVGEGAAFAAFSPRGKLILSRGTGTQEKIEIASVVGDVITLSSPVANTHTGVVYRSLQGTDQVIVAGTVIYVPGVLGTPDIEYFTLADVTLLDGDVQTDLVDVVSVLPGLGTVVAENRIRRVRTPPFSTISVWNPAPTYRGRDREEDEELRDRYQRRKKTLSKGTPLALEDALLGVTSGAQEIRYARIVQPIGPGVSTMYVDDGSGSLSYGYTAGPTHETPIYNSTPGRTLGRVRQWPVQGGSPLIYKDVERGSASAVGVLTLTDASKTWVVNAYAGHLLVDDQGGVWSVPSNTATTLTLALIASVSPSSTPSLGGYGIVDVTTPLSLFDVSALPLTSPTASDDLLFNYSTGEFKLNPLAYPTGMDQYGALVVLSYNHASGVIQEAARVLEGDPTDPTAYPGYKAAGTLVNLTLPVIRSLAFTFSISADQGFTESLLSPLVKDAAVQYVNSRGLRSNEVVLSEITRRCKGIQGMRDFVVLSPSTNPIIAEGELPRTSASLITVV